MQLQRAEDEAEAKKDLPALERLLDEDFIFTAPNGNVSNKQKLIGDVKNDDSAGTSTLGYEEIKTFDYGKTAVINYLLVVKGQDENKKDFTNSYRISAVWINRQGNWRLRAIHSSRIRQ